MAELDQLTAATRRYIRETPKLVDMVFQEAALVALAKTAFRDDFPGGYRIDESFFYNGLIGGPYLKGKDFDITEPQIEQNLQFNIKFFEVNITLSKEDVQVLNTGPAAAFRLIKSRTVAAYMTAGAHLDIGMYLNGLDAGYTANFNGFTEAFNDNTTTNWNATAYATFGTITRGGAVGTVLNSPATNVGGTIEYNTLEETYSAASFGPGKEPTHGLATYLAYSYIKEKFQTQQRFIAVKDPVIGFSGMEFNDAILIRDRYAPGTYISGTGDPVATTFIRQMSSNAITAYPTVTSETFWWINARKPFFNFYISTDPEYQFGFTGWKPAQGNTKIVGQVLFAGALTIAPRYGRQLYGITG